MSRRRRPRGPGFPFPRRARAFPALLLVAALAALCGRPQKPGGPEPADGPRAEPADAQAPAPGAGRRPAVLPESGPEAPAEGAPEGHRVVSVDDGDTLTLADGTQVRYLGIDTPERGEPFSREAREENRRLAGGRRVFLERGGPEETDHYGRRLAIVQVAAAEHDAGAAINAALLRAGLANVYISGPEAIAPDILRALLAAQGEAIAARRGIWKRWLAGGGRPGTRFVATRFRLHVESCAELKDARPRPVESLERALREGKSFCRTCKATWDG
jgi:endonuclease YncB( thermonuclease family)